jgi:class 3 adenylate cyclase
VECTSCRAANPPTNKFCGECGAALARICTACDSRNPPSNRFCGECGARLIAETEPVRAAPAPAQLTPETYTPRHLADRILASRDALEGERKHVTVLFADVVGSTELIQDLDPEEARSLLEPAVRAMLEAVHRFEGTVCRVMGDGIMALFGAPLAHEDHAARASYAALTMQQSIRAYADTVRASAGVELQARVGLNSGEVVVGSISNDLYVEYSAIGPTTHLAARMEQLAVPGTVRLTAETVRLVDGLVDVRPLGRIPVKGVTEPVEVFELLGAGPGRRRFQVAAARGLTPFVGRLSELDALGRALDRAGAGHGQIVAPVGEPGVGKLRLLYEFIHSEPTRGWLVLESGSVSYGKATSYLPVIDLLKSFCRIEPHDDARTIREKVTGRLVALDPALSAMLEHSRAQVLRNGHRPCASLWAGWLADAYLMNGRLVDAAEAATTSLDLARANREYGFEGMALRALGDVVAAAESPDVVRSEDLYRHALAIAEELSMRPLQAHTHLSLGKLYRRHDRPRSASERGQAL